MDYVEVLESAMKEVRFPGIRTQIVSVIVSLSDRAYQERVWIRHELPHPDYYDEFDLAVHALFDDSPILPSPAPGCVGELIYADEEVPLAQLGEILGPLIDELGDVPDAEYLNSAQWPEVVRRAKAVREIMERNDGAFGY
ncbi:SCO4402 family protein [Amycolatopsis sp. GA6-003]|uniref:SCO4402 family protein n=1 Tax=Amycolatopsis sp. GA6-003 TaxID=2652444 RepID=UPI00391763E6